MPGARALVDPVAGDGAATVGLGQLPDESHLLGAGGRRRAPRRAGEGSRGQADRARRRSCSQAADRSHGERVGHPVSQATQRG